MPTVVMHGSSHDSSTFIQIGNLILVPPHGEPSGQVEGKDAPAGWLISDLTDPFMLQVHRSVDADSLGTELPVLPSYVSRHHDVELAGVVEKVAAGRSMMAVMVGGSSTGKTRACWEAMRQLPSGWRLWHPFDPSPPEALLGELPRVGSRTVVWLNETQLYLDTPNAAGERVAAAVRTLLNDPQRAPLLVLGTLWPEYWNTFNKDNTHPQARALLNGTDITVPDAFTDAALADLRRAAVSDPRLDQAAAAGHGRITQYLAGVPELLSRYHRASPAARALIHAAMDARRMGHGPALPLALLAAAAPAYLTDAEWDDLGDGDNWLAQAITYVAAPAIGISGPLTRIQPRPPASRAGRSSNDGHQQGEPAYRLADYLDQYGRQHRAGEIPPIGFWDAAATHGRPADQAALASAAHARGLYRDAAQLYKQAVGDGDAWVPTGLIRIFGDINADEPRATRWAVAHIPLDDPANVAILLNDLRKTGEQAAVLVDRNPAAHVSLETYGVGMLLHSFKDAGANRQFNVLAERALAQAPVDNARHVATLLGAMWSMRSDEQAAAFFERAALLSPLDDPEGLADLLNALFQLRAIRQLTVLADRVAAQTSISKARDVAVLLAGLRKAYANQQFSALLDRDPVAHVSLDDPFGLGRLLRVLREAGEFQQVTTLAARAGPHASLDDQNGVAMLLRALHYMREFQALTALAGRVAADAAVDDPAGVALLLKSLQETGASRQFTVLAHRASRQTFLEDPGGVAKLLSSLQEAGADRNFSVLLKRSPAAHASLASPSGVTSLLGELRKAGAGREVGVLTDRASHHVSLSSPGGVAALLKALRVAGAYSQFSVLAARAAVEFPIASGYYTDMGLLLDELLEAGAHQESSALLARLPAAGQFSLFRQRSGSQFRFGREPDGRPADPWGWDDLI